MKLSKGCSFAIGVICIIIGTACNYYASIMEYTVELRQQEREEDNTEVSEHVIDNEGNYPAICSSLGESFIIMGSVFIPLSITVTDTSKKEEDSK